MGAHVKGGVLRAGINAIYINDTLGVVCRITRINQFFLSFNRSRVNFSSVLDAAAVQTLVQDLALAIKIARVWLGGLRRLRLTRLHLVLLHALLKNKVVRN